MAVKSTAEFYDRVEFLLKTDRGYPKDTMFARTCRVCEIIGLSSDQYTNCYRTAHEWS